MILHGVYSVYMDNVLTQTERPADCAKLDVIISRGIRHPHQRISTIELIKDFGLHQQSCHECELIAAWDLLHEEN